MRPMHGEIANAAPEDAVARRGVTVVLRLVARTIAVLDSCPMAVGLLFARVSVAQVFWRAGRTKAEGWTISGSTFALFEQEYQVPLLPSDVAAVMVTGAEHLCPILLVLGLGARFGAANLLFMTAVIQVFVYPDAWPTHILWISLLFLVLIRGPGSFSLDRLIHKRWVRRAIP